MAEAGHRGGPQEKMATFTGAKTGGSLDKIRRR